MATFIPKPTWMRKLFTRVPHIFFDEIMILCTPAEWKVLSLIIRKTFGFNKNRDRISVSQIVKLTGLSESGVHNSLKSLEKKNLLLQTSNYTNGRYGLAKEWELVSGWVNIKTAQTKILNPY